MNSNGTTQPIQLPSEVGARWIEESLRQGHAIATSVLTETSRNTGRFYALAVERDAPPTLSELEHGIGLDGEAADDALVGVLDELASRGATSIVIEDDVARRGDPVLKSINEATGFLGDRVIHWHAVGEGSSRGAQHAIRSGATGYPLNAFLVSKTIDDLDLHDGAQIDPGLATEVVDSLVALITSGFDAESYVIWEVT